MPLENFGSETVLNAIRNNGTRARLVGIDSSLGGDPNNPTYSSSIENITWLSPTNSSGTWTVTTNPLNAATWLIEPPDNETITITEVRILDINNNIVATSDGVNELFERDGEFTLEQFIVAVE